MIQQIKLKYTLKYILSLLIIFSFVKSQEEIALENGSYSDLITSEDELLSFKVKKIKDFPYLKIKVKGNGETEKTNHIISYYQDKNLNERKQLSQSITDTSIMWLTEEQIQNDFYLTIECAKYPCEYKLSLTGEDMAELGVNEQYTYYVSEDNKEMNFKINSDIDDTDLDSDEVYFIKIWTRGNYEIKVALNEEYEDKKNDENYQFFKIDYDSFSNEEYNLKIEGKVGDLINVGVLLVHKDGKTYDFPQLKIENGLEVTNNFKQDETHSYNIKGHSNMFLGHFYDFNNKIIHPTGDQNSYIISSTDDLSYSIHFLETTEYDRQGNNKYSPLLNGIYNLKIIEEGTSIGLIPMKPEDDFKFLTYEIFPHDGNISVSIYTCENYPLCHINDKILEKSEKIKDYQSYYYVYNKKEWGNEINPISKKQNMLIISCKKGVDFPQVDGDFCFSYINMKTDKAIINNTDFVKEVPPYRRFIRKGNEDLYFLKGNKEKDIYLNIETFTGNINIEISPDDYKKYECGNKLLYIIPQNKDISLKIEGLANSVYSISDNYITVGDYLKIGSNYLFILDKHDYLNIDPKDQSTYIDVGEYPYYIGIYSLNCSISVEEENGENIILEKNQFYQKIDSTSKQKHFTVRKKNNKDICLFYVSCHKLENFNSDSNGIPLGNSTSQSFKFNKKNNSMVYSFPHTEIEKDINIDFKLTTEGQFKVKIMADGQNIINDKIDSKNKNIKLGSSELEKKCDDFKFICKILLYLELEELEKESEIEITINKEGDSSLDDDSSDDNSSDDTPSEENPSADNTSDTTGKDDDDDDDDDDDKVFIVILSILVVIVIILIVGGLIYYYKVKAKGKDLNAAVNQISFKDDQEREGDIDTLLD